MRISAIGQFYLNKPYSSQRRSNRRFVVPESIYGERNNVLRAEDSKVYNCSNISFGNIPNSEPMRILFRYGIPGMYSGITMIDSSLTEKMIKSGIFSYPASISVKALAIFKDRLPEVEKEVLRKMEARAKTHPDEDLQELLIGLSRKYKKKLREQQRPIFANLRAMSDRLPYTCQEAFDDLMRKTEDMLNDRPIVSMFNKFSFQYKLAKIRDDLQEIATPKIAKVVTRMVNESALLSDIDSLETREGQKEIIQNMIDVMKSHPYLKDYEPLRRLLLSSVSTLNREPVKISFSRLNFLSDLSAILEHTPDAELRDRMLTEAAKLPTSKEAVDAYIVKYQDAPPDKIAYRLLRPTTASVEHIHPKSMGGANNMANYGGATAEENSARGNVPFTEQLQRRPMTAEYAQAQIDRFIQLKKEGIYAKYGIDPKHIEDFAETIKRESKGEIRLDTSELYT